MCDACSAKGHNWSLNNGPGKSRLEKAKLYGTFEGREISLRLCYLCSITLFMSGEKKFIRLNPALETELNYQYGADEFDF